MILHDQLIRDEGCRLTCYQDTLGNWTVGVGHKVPADLGTITQDLADTWLDQDITRASFQVENALSWVKDLETTDPYRFYVLVNMAFNMGIGGLLQFHHFLGYMQTGDWYHAAEEMLNSTWANQVGDRAKRLSLQVIIGIMV